MTPELSVIIPVHNRGPVIRYTLESVRRASAGLDVETIVVDDGSEPPTAGVLAELGFTPSVLVRQANQGLLYARLAGLARATGRHVLFLDSDDLVSADKFRLQLAALGSTGADVCYTDFSHCVLEGDYDSLRPVADPPCAETEDATEFGIRVQPPPHSPMFEAAWLRRIAEGPFISPSPLYNACAEIWFYQNGALLGGRAVRVPGPHAIVGMHPGARLTGHWERIAVGSLAVMEAFARVDAGTPAAARARRLMAEAVFRAWRALPRDFSPEFGERLVGLWRRLGEGRTAELGSRRFRMLAGMTGPLRAARLLRRWRARPYAASRTLTDAEFRDLLSMLPPP
jgi:hypothetical protein